MALPCNRVDKIETILDRKSKFGLLQRPLMHSIVQAALLT